MDQLPAFLKTFSPNKGANLSKSAEEKGTPHTLIIAPAALRAADLVRYAVTPNGLKVAQLVPNARVYYSALRSFQNKESIVGKLFAKHIKLEEAKQFLERTRYAIRSRALRHGMMIT